VKADAVIGMLSMMLALLYGHTRIFSSIGQEHCFRSFTRASSTTLEHRDRWAHYRLADLTPIELYVRNFAIKASNIENSPSTP
jgi:hypothetical protein